MKKTSLPFILLFLTISAAHAQFSGTPPGFIYYDQGNVGIGTSTPGTANLHVGKQHAAAATAGQALRLSLQPYGHTGGPWNFTSRDIPASAFLDIGYGSLHSMTFSSDGKIGIGTQSPVNANLHIGKAESFAGSAGEMKRLALQPYGHNGGLWEFVCRDNSEFAFLDINYGSMRGLTINSSGNVGIGMAANGNMSAKLTVAGNIHSREVNVTINAGSDFVFEDTYRLKTLEEVEQYIKVNKHLPDVAPATEMEANGIELGKMDMKLLQKIEELTLYLIEQNKKLESQNEEIENLKKEIRELKKK